MAEDYHTPEKHEPQPRKKLTLRQFKYKKNRLLGMTQRDAAFAAGYSRLYSAHAASRVERLVKVSIMAELDRAGVTDRVLARKLAQKLESKRPFSAKIVLKENGDLVREESGMIQVDDNIAQIKAVELAAKLKKHLRDSDDLPSGSVSQIVIIRSEVNVNSEPSKNGHGETIDAEVVRNGNGFGSHEVDRAS